MRRFAALLLLLAPVTLAQSLSEAALQAKLEAPQASTLCPVEATARRGGAGDFLVVAGEREGSNAALSLTLKPRDGRRILAADVTVHALSARGRVWSLGSNPEPDILRRFTLTDTRAGQAAFTSALALAQAATVAWVEITALRYSDSTAWHAGTRDACRVTPEALTPVLARR